MLQYHTLSYFARKEINIILYYNSIFYVQIDLRFLDVQLQRGDIEGMSFWLHMYLGTGDSNSFHEFAFTRMNGMGFCLFK